jgi:hypothetical protein
MGDSVDAQFKSMWDKELFLCSESWIRVWTAVDACGRKPDENEAVKLFTFFPKLVHGGAVSLSAFDGL